jgi:hypothetical protein
MGNGIFAPVDSEAKTFGSLGFNGVIKPSLINKLHATAQKNRTCFSEYPLKSLT